MEPRGHLDIGGVSLEHKWIEGDCGKPAIVLLHEGLGCVGTWKDFPSRLQVATGCAIFTYSRQGYGNSDPCELPRPLSYMHDEADTLAGILEHIPADEFVLVGHSDGASIAAIHAAKYPNPGLRGLVLIAPHFFVEDVALESIAQAKLAYESSDLRTRLQRFHGTNVDCAFRGWNEAWLDSAFTQWDITDCLMRVEVPVLGIQGSEDEYGTLAQLQEIENLPENRGQTLVLENCGHSVHNQCAAELTIAATEFIASTSRRITPSQ